MSQRNKYIKMTKPSFAFFCLIMVLALIGFINILLFIYYLIF